jgi:hypothetical protein
MKKVIFILFILVQLIQVNKVFSIQFDKLYEFKDKMQAVLNEYSTIRERSFFDNCGNIEHNTKVISKTILFNETERSKKLIKMKERLNYNIVYVQSSFTIKDISLQNNVIIVKAYEWILFNHKSGFGEIYTSGYGTNHDIKIVNNNDSYEIIFDSYDEGPFTRFTSNDYLLNNEVPAYMNRTILSMISLKTLFNAKDFEKSTEDTTYNYSSAVSYANEWVFHSSVPNQLYEDYYNNECYINYNSYGGDCANYVSQCLLAGGIEYDPNYSSNTWWYNHNGTYNTTSDDEASLCWINANYNFDYMSANEGTATDDPTENDISIGNPVYYDWDGSGDFHADHVTICTGYAYDQNNNIYHFVNSHNYDYYHIRWDYGDTCTKYSTIIIE